MQRMPAAAAAARRGTCRVRTRAFTRAFQPAQQLYPVPALPPPPPLRRPQEANPDAVAPKPHEFKAARRQVAQLLTLLREREIADGISRKDSRKLRKEAKVAAGFGRF